MAKNVFDLLVTALEMESLEGVDLGKKSSDYYHAYQRVLECQNKIKGALPLELQETLMQLEDEYACMRLNGMDVYYRQGFSDAVRLIMQSLTWGPTRS